MKYFTNAIYHNCKLSVPAAVASFMQSGNCVWVKHKLGRVRRSRLMLPLFLAQLVHGPITPPSEHMLLFLGAPTLIRVHICCFWLLNIHCLSPGSDTCFSFREVPFSPFQPARLRSSPCPWHAWGERGTSSGQASPTLSFLAQVLTLRCEI